MTDNPNPEAAMVEEYTIAAVEARIPKLVDDAKDTPGMSISDWVAHRMKTAVNSAAAAIQSAPPPVTGGEGTVPVAYMRRWAFDKNEGTKGNRPRGWKLHAVTEIKCLDDDVPLFATPATGGTFADGKK